MVVPLEWLNLTAAEPKRGDERVVGLTHKSCEERADGLTLKIDGERVERLTHKIDEDRADRWTDKTCGERADGWTCSNMVEQVLVDGDGSEYGGCNKSLPPLKYECVQMESARSRWLWWRR